MATAGTTARATTWLLAGIALAAAVGAGCWWLTRTPAEPPPALQVMPPAMPPMSRPAMPIDVGGPIEDPVVATATPAPAPVQPVATTSPSPEPPQPAWQTFVLADGRIFIGTCNESRDAIISQAAVRGGALIRMPPITVRVPAQGIVSQTPYDGALGPVIRPLAAPDPAREADLARQRDTAAARAEQRRLEAAERERIRLRALQREQATKRLATAELAVENASSREQVLAGHAGALDEDRRLQLELVNGLQLQLNTAQDRWNMEVQTLGTRVVKPDGTFGGGPTAATESLVVSLQQQIVSARQAATAAERRKAAEAAERLQVLASMPQLTATVANCKAELAALDDPTH